MRLIYYYIFLCILFPYSDKPFFDLFKLNNNIIAQIEKGNVVTIKTDTLLGPGEHYQAYTLVNANITDVFKAIENFDEYPKFMPSFDSVETIYNSDTLTTYIFNIILPLNIHYKYKIKSKEYINSSCAWLAWETIPWEENSIKETWGQWYLTPYQGSNRKTLIQYQVYTDPGYIPFGLEWIIDIMTKKSLPKTIKNLKIWIENDKK